MTAEEVLKDDSARKIFDLLVERKRLLFRDIVETSGEQPKTAKAALDKLVKCDLLAESRAGIEDLSSFYVTASGLATERALVRRKRA